MFTAFFCFLSLVEQRGWPVEAAIPAAVLLGALLGIVIQNGILRFMQRGRIVITGTADEVDGRIDEIEATYLSHQRMGDH